MQRLIKRRVFNGQIAAGLFDDDFGIRPDKHIFVDFMPAWDDLQRELPAYTRRQIYELRTGKKAT